MTEFRCEKCHKLLAKVDLKDGVVEIKCPRCKETNTKQEGLQNEFHESGLSK